jgi:hypothetical protein
MNLHKIFGDRLYLFHQAQPYRNYLLCPVQHEGRSGFGAAIFPPDGEPDLATLDDPTYPTAEAAIEAAKRSVDTACTYWLLGALLDEWKAIGLISALECIHLHIQLEDWYGAAWRGLEVIE